LWFGIRLCFMWCLLTSISSNKVLLTAASTLVLNFWLASRVGVARKKYKVEVHFIVKSFFQVQKDADKIFVGSLWMSGTVSKHVWSCETRVQLLSKSSSAHVRNTP
jgi:hypothetical protein